MAPPTAKDNARMDAEVREKIHLEILKRTGAYPVSYTHLTLPTN